MALYQEPDVPEPSRLRETEPLLQRPQSTASHDTQNLSKQLTARHAFAVLVTSQIGSGIFASPAQVDSNVPSPGAALLVWVLGGMLSWAGAASFAELGAAMPLNGGMQEYLRHVYGDTAAFLMAWIYIVAVKPSSIAIQSIVIAESIGSVGLIDVNASNGAALLKIIAALSCLLMVLLNSISTRFTLRMSESFTVLKIGTVGLIVLGGLVAVLAHTVNSHSSLSGSSDWYSKNWFDTRPTTSNGETIDWTNMEAWDRYGHYCAAIYGGLWAYDGWDNANIVASEIRDPGHALPKAIKAAMLVVLSSFELVNVAYYVLLPWHQLSASNAVAVSAATSLLGRPAGIVITLLVAISCAGSITSNIFSVGRLTIAASQRSYLPAIFSKRGLLVKKQSAEREVIASTFDAPLYANLLVLIISLIYIYKGSFRALLTFVGMASWVFYVSTAIGLLILRRREPQLDRPYRPTKILPITFAVIGIFVIIRSAMFAPTQSGLLTGLLIAGTIVSRMRGGSSHDVPSH